MVMEKKDFISELSKNERSTIHDHAPLPPRMIFNIIRQEGEEELERPFQALAFSALAAGILVSFSFLFRSIFHMHMAGSSMEPLVSCLGYTVGFLIVILGRMQLFTENPITTIIPLLSEWSWARFYEVVRLWSIVFFFNIVGTAIAAIFYASPYTLSPEIEAAMHEVAVHVMHLGPIENVLRGIPAGILIAALVWTSPQTRYFRFVMILFLVYFIALGDFAHVVVGSCEMAYIVLAHDASISDYLFRFLIPCGIGNIIGGTLIFTLLVYYQVAKELKSEKARRSRN